MINNYEIKSFYTIQLFSGERIMQLKLKMNMMIKAMITKPL